MYWGKYKDKYEPLQKIEAQIKEIKGTVEKIHKKKEEKRKDITKMQLKSQEKTRWIVWWEACLWSCKQKEAQKNNWHLHIFTKRSLWTSAFRSRIITIRRKRWSSPKRTGKTTLKETLRLKSSRLLLQQGKRFSFIMTRRNAKFLSLSSNTELDPKHALAVSRNYRLSAFEEHGLAFNYQQEKNVFSLKRPFKNGLDQVLPKSLWMFYWKASLFLSFRLGLGISSAVWCSSKYSRVFTLGILA